MNNQIKQILNDLYQIDGSFRSHEAKLVKIITKLLEAESEIKIDEGFIKALRARVMAEEKKASKVSIFSFFLRPAFVMSSLVIVIVAASVYYVSVKPDQVGNLALDSGIVAKGENAFGKLASGGDNGAMPAVGGAESSDGIGSAMPIFRPQSGGGGGIASESAMIGMPYYGGENYNFTYVGDEFSVDEPKLAVYKKSNNQATSRALAKLISQAGLSALDLSKFSNTEIENITLKEDKAFGYMINIDMYSNSFNIYKNWSKWPQPGADCRDQGCYESFLLKPSDVPADSQLIAIADAFVSKYNIDMTSYGSGQVDRQWEESFASQPELIYAPEQIMVTYPLSIAGLKVYEEDGRSDGLYVDIDVRENKGAGLREVSVMSFESSLYESETNKDTIFSYMKKGGMNRRYTDENAAKTITVELGTPTQGLVKIWQYDEVNQRSAQIYVPALIFPIESIDKPNYLYQKNIVVPLIKEIIEDQSNGKGGIIPMGVPESLPGVEIEPDLEVNSVEL